MDSTEVKEQLNKSFIMVQDTLYRDSKINLRFSGSTCVSVLIVGTKVFCANVGDSRAVLSGDEGSRIFALSRDHKPLDEFEEKRVIEAGGKIYSR